MTDTNPGGWPDPAKPGYPANPERDGAHALRHKETGETSPALWLGAAIEAIWIDGDGEDISPYHAASLYDYLGPCHTPAEVAALRAALRDASLDLLAANDASLLHAEATYHAGAEAMRRAAQGACQAAFQPAPEMHVTTVNAVRAGIVLCVNTIRALPLPKMETSND
jgi:hypothetical protein